jgi:hypothetical protein
MRAPGAAQERPVKIRFPHPVRPHLRNLKTCKLKTSNLMLKLNPGPASFAGAGTARALFPNALRSGNRAMHPAAHVN